MTDQLSLVSYSFQDGLHLSLCFVYQPFHPNYAFGVFSLICTEAINIAECDTLIKICKPCMALYWSKVSRKLAYILGVVIHDDMDISLQSYLFSC